MINIILSTKPQNTANSIMHVCYGQDTQTTRNQQTTTHEKQVIQLQKHRTCIAKTVAVCGKCNRKHRKYVSIQKEARSLKPLDRIA